jgi:DNA (cytosine-5)-methyltransferase 3A
MKVLSLFDGMSTAQKALENVGIKVDKYYSSEIKPYAIELTQHHFPDTIQVGDVTKWREWDIDWKSIDLVLSGSPCQDLSAAGKRAGINGKKSSLFFVFVDILNHIKALNPKVLFLQENVGSASKLDVGIMSRALGVYPVRINSSLMVAALRDRYYWSNIRTRQDGMFGDVVTDIPQPKDRGIMFKDIITGGRVERLKALALLESESRICVSQESIKNRAEKQFINVIQQDGIVRTVNQVEMERLQGFPDGYTSILSKAKAGSLLGDGWTLPIIEHIFSFIKK